jgi:hypothetical protein
MQLPIVIQHNKNVYLFDALPVCIIEAYPDLRDWLLHHYMNITSNTCSKNMVYEKIVLRYPEGDLYSYRHKTREVLEYNAILVQPVINNIGVVNFLKETLEAGFYIITFLDEYFLSCKISYQKYHFIHESLIYGYSNEENIFYAISFNKDRAFTSLAFPYKEVEIGVTSAFQQYPDYSLFIHFYIIKPIKVHIAFDFAIFKYELNNYLNSTVDLVDKYHLYLVDREIEGSMVNYTFGSKVYDELIKVYTSLYTYVVGTSATGTWLSSWDNYQNFHLLAEHKQHVLKSLRHVNTAVLEKPVLSTLLESYSRIVNEHELLRMRQLKFFLKVSKYPLAVPPSFDDTIAKLQELKDRELAILTHIMSLLP